MKFVNTSKELDHIVKIMEQCFDALQLGAIAFIVDKKDQSHEGLIVSSETANNLPYSTDVGSLIKIKQLQGGIKEFDVMDISMIIPITDDKVKQRYVDIGLIEIVEIGNEYL